MALLSERVEVADTADDLLTWFLARSLHGNLLGLVRSIPSNSGIGRLDIAK